MRGQQGHVVPWRPSPRALPQASPPPGGPQPHARGGLAEQGRARWMWAREWLPGDPSPDPRHPSLPRRGLRLVSVSVQASAGTCVRYGQVCVQGDWLPSHPTAPRQLRPGVTLWPTRGEHRARVLRRGPGCVGTRLTRTSGSCGQCSLGTASVAGPPVAPLPPRGRAGFGSEESAGQDSVLRKQEPCSPPTCALGVPPVCRLGRSFLTNIFFNVYLF